MTTIVLVDRKSWVIVIKQDDSTSRSGLSDICSEVLREVLMAAQDVLQKTTPTGAVTIGLDWARDPAHGDFASNVGLALGPRHNLAPRELAEAVGKTLAKSFADLESYSVDGPGFLNLRLKPTAWHRELKRHLAPSEDLGVETLGQGKTVNIEYVSANPTGPMHIGHARGAVVGDVIATLLERTGHRVIKEYYINDGGAQIDALARSIYYRYAESLGATPAVTPEGFYPGDYLQPVGKNLAARDGKRWLDQPETEWREPLRQFTVAAMLDLIRADLAALGIKHDVFTSERETIARGAVNRALEELQAKGLLYQGVLEPPKGQLSDDWEPRPQTLFKSTDYGDDVDRAVKKSDGSWTYFANDIAYHKDKTDGHGDPTQRADILIDILGVDHGGYVKRIGAAVKALTTAQFEARLCALVNLLDQGKPVKMSKRSGTFVTLREVVDEVGKDVVRFIMLTRRSDMKLDFDLAKVVEQTKDNPVFYVQYAHARAASVLRHAVEAELILHEFSFLNIDLAPLTSPEELHLIKLIARWLGTIEAAAIAREPHRIAYYLQELATGFHMLWNKGNDNANLRFILLEQPEVTMARLALVTALKMTIADGLRLVGVAPLEQM